MPITYMASILRRELEVKQLNLSATTEITLHSDGKNGQVAHNLAYLYEYELVLLKLKYEILRPTTSKRYRV
jgi:hypothetical protein